MPDRDRIAELAGVSKSTVHRALHNAGRISDETRDRVLAAAREVGYRPNQIARSLRIRRTETIGIVVTSLAGPFYGLMLEGIETAAQERRYGVLLTCSHRCPEKERALVEILLEKKVDGLILSPADPSANGAFYRQLVDQGLPLVFIDRAIPGTPIDRVAADNFLGGSLAARHLLSVGRRRIAFLTPPAPRSAYTSVQERLEGCNRALGEQSLGPAIVLGPERADVLPLPRFAQEVVREYVLAGGAFDGLFAANDDLAIGAVSGLAQGGLSVPKDVSVIGFGDEGMGAYFSPALTTIRVPLRRIGSEAVELLFRRMRREETLAAPRRVLIEPSLIVRESCGGAQPPPAG